MFLWNFDTNVIHLEKWIFEALIFDKKYYGFENFYGPNFRVFSTVSLWIRRRKLLITNGDYPVSFERDCSSNGWRTCCVSWPTAQLEDTFVRTLNTDMTGRDLLHFWSVGHYTSSTRVSYLFLGKFAKLRKTIISSVTSVRPHGITRLPLDVSSWKLILHYLKKNVSIKFKFH